MANSHPSLKRWIAAALLSLLAAGASAQLAVEPGLPIVMDADNSELNLADNTTVFYGLRITQGATRIEARRAQTAAGTNFADSSWQFSGNVEIDVDGASIRAENAELRFVSHRLVSARVTGEPARFIDQRTGVAAITEGQAERFDYDLDAGVVRFEGNAKISDEANEVTGALLIYDVKGQQVAFEGDANTGERVKIVVQPPDDAADAVQSAAEDAAAEAIDEERDDP
ncbi:MAG: LptA/OstA family protein [Pseudomonadota bacterium]